MNIIIMMIVFDANKEVTSELLHLSPAQQLKLLSEEPESESRLSFGNNRPKNPSRDLETLFRRLLEP